MQSQLSKQTDTFESFKYLAFHKMYLHKYDTEGVLFSRPNCSNASWLAKKLLSLKIIAIWIYFN